MNLHFSGSFRRCEETGFAHALSDTSLTKIASIFVDSTCHHDSEGEHTLLLWGSVLNMPEISHLLKSNGKNPRLLDLFLAHPPEKVLPLIDGNVTGILVSKASTLIFRDKNGGGPPVYYSQHHFSSNIDGLTAMQKTGLQANLQSISCFLAYGYIPSPFSAFQGISKIPAGYSLVYKEGTLSLTNTYPFSHFISSYQSLKIPEQEAADRYIELHRKAIQKRINGNDTVGILLSGGYDSGGNLARLRDVYSGEIKSFSIGFKRNQISELPYARQLAAQFGTNHFEYEMDGHEIEYLPEIINGFSDPFQENGLMLNICAMKLLVGQHHVSTTLCGEGNDQLYGVHGRELAIHYFAKKTGISLFQNIVYNITSNRAFLPNDNFYRNAFYNDRILHIVRPDRFGFNQTEQKLLFQSPQGIPQGYCLFDNRFHYRNFTELYLGKTYFIDIQQTINEVIAYKAVRSASVYGNSLAFPLLDRDIYQFIIQLPRSYRMHGSFSNILRGKGVSKYIYKRSLKGELPEKVVARKKQGGFAPMAIFFQEEARLEGIFKYILNSDMTSQLINSETLMNYFNKFSREINKQNSWFWYTQFHCFQLFSLLILALWWDQFINNKRYSKLSDYIGVEIK